MSDTVDAGPLPWNERHADNFETVQTHLDGRQAAIHTSMPGAITKFDQKSMTVTVQPAIKATYTDLDGSKKPITITTIADVPVHFPGGGGHSLTFPVKSGDECLIVFQERGIDGWFQHGGTQLPSDQRMHDLSDAVALVGLRSQPNVLKNMSTSTVQLRSDDGNTLVEVDGPNGNVKLTASNVTVGKSGGKVSVLGGTLVPRTTITGTGASPGTAVKNLLIFLALRGDIIDASTS